MWPDSPPSPPGPPGFGLGYGMTIAVGVLFLVSTVLLASYVCIRAKAGAPRRSLPSPPPHAAATAAVEGLTRPAIDAFYPRFVYGRGGGAAGPLPAGPCPICLEEYEGGVVLRRGPECGHCFHAACVDEWLKVSATCPLCRGSPLPSAAATPAGTPLSELIPLAAHGR